MRKESKNRSWLRGPKVSNVGLTPFSFVFLFLLWTKAFAILPIDPGIQSGDLPEKYEKKEILELPKKKVIQLFLEDGGKESVANGVYDGVAQNSDMNTNVELGRFGIDSKENVYLMFSHSVFVFNDKSDLIHTITQSINANEDFRVDEEGDVAICDHIKWHFYNPQGFEISTTNRDNFPGGFSHGIFYSPHNGEIKFKMRDEAELEQKQFIKEVVKARRERGGFDNSYHKNFYLKGGQKLPGKIDGFIIQTVDHLDYAGNVYVDYSQHFPNKYENPIQQWRTYKFDPQGNILAKFDSLNNYFNPKTQAVYHLELDENSLRVIKFGKTNP